MQKTDFIARVAEGSGVSKKTARQVIETALDVIARQPRPGRKSRPLGLWHIRDAPAPRSPWRQPADPPDDDHSCLNFAGFSASNNLKETVRQSQARERGGKNS